MSPKSKQPVPQWLREAQPEEVVATAIARERGAARRYAAMARSAEDRVVKAKLRYLAAEEGEHARLLRAMAKALPRPRQDFRPPAGSAEARGDWDRPSVQQALDMAIRSEREARSLYESAASLCRHAKSRGVFRELARAEERHEMLLRQELSLQRDQQGWRGLLGTVWSEEDFW